MQNTEVKRSMVLGIMYFRLAKAKLTIYSYLFYSNCTYCVLLWGRTTAMNVRRLLIYRKEAVRVIADVPYNTHIPQV